ncbi:hypothetical protein SBOR_3252 [Sclerotinia borealis F-4128]|uniref:Uncharacterized protein n=1 Tax=Sclerotinia borealis (strain F-4128) TaxID=1432307 RepID=W9CP34_SCLBF|nr:hypothetical protein SBOR_3252 [Sclerotinia borealis F-4128]
MGWFGNQDLSAKFGIVLGGSIFVVLVAGLLKVWYNKRRLAKNIKIEEIEKANSTQERLNIEDLGEGDLFGIRAIERGFFGGVSQSRSNSPAQSMFGPPSTTVTDLLEPPRNVESVRDSSTASSSSSLSRRSVEISAPKSIKHKPKPLRIQPSDAEIRRSAMPNAGGSYIPPSPMKEAQSQSNLLDVNFSRPSVLESPPIRSYSDEELSQLRYQGDVPRNYMFLAGQHSTVRSQAGSIYGSAESSPNNPANVLKIPTPPAPTHVFGFSPRHSHRSRSRSTTPEGLFNNRSSSRSPELPVPSIPSPYKTSYQPTTFLEEPDTKSKRRSYQPTHPSEPHSESELHTHHREPSLATSTLTTRTSILDEPFTYTSTTTTRPRGRTSHQHTRSNSSTTHTTQHTHGQISRTHDSLRISRKSTPGKVQVQVQGQVQGQGQGRENRHSRDRDQLHYDPTSGPSARTRSGGVKGRAVDFDRPRKSPFSNSNAISGQGMGQGSVKSHASKESFSSASTSSAESSWSEGEVGDVEEMGWRRGGGGGGARAVVGVEETIVEVLTPMTSRGQRFDASDLV